MPSMSRDDLSTELRRLSRLDTVKAMIPGHPSYQSPDSYVEEWKQNVTRAYKRVNEARLKYRARAVQALADLREYGESWHPSRGSIASWEEALGWAEAAPFDVRAKVAEHVDKFEKARSAHYSRLYNNG